MVYQSILFHYMPSDAIIYHYQTIHCVYSSFFHLHNVACSLCCTKTQQLGCERNCLLPDPSDIMNK